MDSTGGKKPAGKESKKGASSTGANIGYEEMLWKIEEYLPGYHSDTLYMNAVGGLLWVLPEYCPAYR